MKRLKIAPYDPNWPDLFQEESEKIKAVLKDRLLEIHHIGSTAVAGLAAKPIIDMIVVVPSFSELSEQLVKIGYCYKGDYNLPMRLLYEKDASPKIYVHAHLEESAEIELNLVFREALRASKPLCEEYARLKLKAAQNPTAGQKRTQTGISLYNLQKNGFITQVLTDSGFNGLCMRLCTQTEEWEAYHRLRKDLLFAPAGIVYDENHPSLTDPALKHLVFIKGTQIIAAGSLEWRNDKIVIVRSLAVDRRFQHQGMGRLFLERLEKWAVFQGAQHAYVNANRQAIPFYQKHGYEKHSFDDDSPMPHILQMGKKLKLSTREKLI